MLPDETPASGFRLGSIAGTSIHMEVSFLILMGLFVFLNLEQGPIERALLWIPILLISVLFHELGHAAVIGMFGFGRSLIVLGGFGGVTINQRQSRPWKEIAISLAGPGFSVLLVAILAGLWTFFPRLQRDPMLAAFFPSMIQANLFWAAFNLVPIYPLDGGQALFNFGRSVTTDRRAAFLSIWLSMILGAAIFVLALFGKSFFLAIIAAMLTMQNFQRWQAYRSGAGPS